VNNNVNHAQCTQSIVDYIFDQDLTDIVLLGHSLGGDEITVGQDPHSLALMLQVLQQFTQQGGALILTSHDLIAAAALGARQIDISLTI
jgi:ABC-type ATPase involved in cell division